jgi:cytochrome c peroxidase
MQPRRRQNRAFLVGLAVLTGAWIISVSAQQQFNVLPDLPRPLVSLKGHRPPDPPNLGEFVRDREAAIVLGKALFWDMQTGSDEQTACATCHFAAGSDHRVRNRLHPGVDAFNRTRSAGATPPAGASSPLNPGDFPFHVLEDIDDPDSTVLFTSNDVLGSQGIVQATFAGIGADGREILKKSESAVFRVGTGVNTAQVRRVTGRHAPTVINAAFNHRNFWDGRANNVFNGVNPFGPRDPDAVVWENVWNGTCWVLLPRRIEIPNAAAASQAVAPPTSDTEMAATNRTFPDIGRKLINRRPLARQRVDPTDSVLGPYVHASGLGLNTTYGELVQRAFWPKWWDSELKVSRTNYSHMEGNFSLFWGLAIQMYEATLVSDDAPIDRYVVGTGSLTPDELAGAALFQDKANCIECHAGPEFTIAATIEFQAGEVGGFLELMGIGVNKAGLYDAAYYNLGVRPTAEDLFQGLWDPLGHPLSFTRQAKNVMAGGMAPDSFAVDTCTFEISVCQPLVDPNIRDAVDGAVKTPTLRNIELTGPYFHNGGYATLEQVVEFYSRGGNARRTANGGDTTGYGPNDTNLAFEMMPIGLSEQEKAQLVAFLKTLTDPRVRNESAPFDHPELFVPDGHPGDARSTPIDGSGRAIDRWVYVPPVGAAGRLAAGLEPIGPWTPPSAPVAAPGLVAAYSFDDANHPGRDRSVKENDGDVDGATWSADGVFGGALSFDGDDMVRIYSSASLSLTNTFTFSAWVKPSALGGWRTVILKEHRTGMSYALYAHDNAPRPAAYVRTGPADQPVKGPSPLPLNQWTHLSATYDGLTFRLYRNGTQVASRALTGSAAQSALQLSIGGNDVWGEYFQGLIDEVRIYDRVLSAAEIVSDMNSRIR